jgi:hypothetical protein
MALYGPIRAQSRQRNEDAHLGRARPQRYAPCAQGMRDRSRRAVPERGGTTSDQHAGCEPGSAAQIGGLPRSPTRGSSCCRSKSEGTRRDLRTGLPRWLGPRRARRRRSTRAKDAAHLGRLATFTPFTSGRSRWREAWLGMNRAKPGSHEPRKTLPARAGSTQRAAARRHATQWGSRKTSHWVAPCGALRTTEHNTLLLQYSVLPRLFPVASRAPPQTQRDALCVPWRPRSSG